MVARHTTETRWYDALSLPRGNMDTSRHNSTADLLLAAGMKAFAERDAAGAAEAPNQLRTLADKRAKQGAAYQAESVRIMQHEVEALAAQLENDKERALKYAAAATAIEENQGPPSGPTYPMTPSHELRGELLLAAGKAEEAHAQLETSLTRTANRTASLLGLARAATALGDMNAANRAYATLQTFLTEADSDVAFLESGATRWRPPTSSSKPPATSLTRAAPPRRPRSCVGRLGVRSSRLRLTLAAAHRATPLNFPPA